jgi:hypothetical protein
VIRRQNLASRRLPTPRERDQRTFRTEEARLAANSKTVVLAEVAPAVVVANHGNVQRVQRMLQRTATGYKTGSITEGYMERVKLVVASRRFPTNVLHTGAGRDSHRSASPFPQTPSASSGEMTRPGATFVAARACWLIVSFPLVDFDPSLPDARPLGDDVISSSIYVVSALEHAYKRTAGPRFVSRMRPLSSSSSNVIVVDLVVARFGIRTHSDDSVTPRSIANSLDEPQSAVVQEWSAAAPSYDGLLLSIDGVRCRCYEACFPDSLLGASATLITDASEWLSGFSLVWCAQLMEVSELSVLLWRAVSLQFQKLPRMLIDVKLGQMAAMVAPICVPTLLLLSKAWEETMDISATTKSQDVPPLSSSDHTPSVGSRAPGQLHRAPSMLAHQVAVAVQTRVSVVCSVVTVRVWTSDLQVIPDTVVAVPEPVLTGLEVMCLRVESVRACVGSSTKYADGKVGLDRFAVTRRHVPVSVDLSGYHASSERTPTAHYIADTPLIFSGCPAPGDEGTEPSPSPDTVSSGADCVSIVFRSGGGQGLASVGIARAGSFVTVGVIEMFITNQTVFEVSRILKAFKQAITVSRSCVGGGDRATTFSSAPLPAGPPPSVGPGNVGDETASRSFTPPFDDLPEVPDSSPSEPEDSSARPQTFSNWDSLFTRLQSLESFSEIAGLVNRAKTAFSASDGLRVSFGQALAHVLVEVEKITVRVLADDQMFASASLEGLRVLRATESRESTKPPVVEDATQTAKTDVGSRNDVAAICVCTLSSAVVHVFRGLPYFLPAVRFPECEKDVGMRVVLPVQPDPFLFGVSYWASEPGAFTEVTLDRFAAYIDVWNLVCLLDGETLFSACLRCVCSRASQIVARRKMLQQR